MGNTTDPVNLLLDLGVLGIVAILFITDRIVTAKALRREQDRADRAEAALFSERQQNAVMREKLDERLIPTVVRLLDYLNRQQEPR